MILFSMISFGQDPDKESYLAGCADILISMRMYNGGVINIGILRQVNVVCNQSYNENISSKAIQGHSKKKGHVI